MQTDSSDYDIVSISVKQEVNDLSKYHSKHFIVLSKEQFLQWLSLYGNKPYGVQYLFPERFTCSSRLIDHIVENRESFISANRKRLYEILYRIATLEMSTSEIWFRNFPKLIVMSTLYLSILYRFSQGETFQESKVPEDRLRSFLVRTRNREVPYNSILEVNQYYLSLVNKNRLFYEYEDQGLCNDFLRECDLII